MNLPPFSTAEIKNARSKTQLTLRLVNIVACVVRVSQPSHRSWLQV